MGVPAKIILVFTESRQKSVRQRLLKVAQWSCFWAAALFATVSAAETFPSARVDGQGVLRWTDGREVNLFGVNYYAPFAYWHTALERAGLDHYATMRMDVEHFKRLGLDCLRIHCFDRQISDREGHLVDPEGHLEKLDYLIALCASNGIMTVLTPMAHWGAGGKYHGGFCDAYCTDGYAALVDDERLWAVQATFLGEFVRHVNPYRGLSYAADPAIPCFELVNEPAYPEGIAPEKVTGYINALADAVRRGGVTKPLFYNPWRGCAKAARAARIDGVTASLYPLGINLGREHRGNQLGNISSDSLFAADETVLAGMPRMIYEFDTADTTASYLYPVLAHVFRTSKAQIAAQFEYDPVLIADTNAGLYTHYLNLVYTPAKALSLAIAAEAFRRLPTGVAPFQGDGRTVRFGAFRVDAGADLSELADETSFLYTNDTDGRPPAPEKLRRVWGHGRSCVVKSDGSGAYFLDRLAPGEWRLQLYPNVFCVDDPFAHRPTLKRVVAKGEVTLSVDLPDLGPAFAVKLNPGDWLLSRGGAAKRAVAGDGPRYVAPPPVVPLPPKREKVAAKRNRAALTAGGGWNFIDTGDDTFKPVRIEVPSFRSKNCASKTIPVDGDDYLAAVPSAGPGRTVLVRARALRPDTTRVELSFVQLDGRRWGRLVPLAPEWKDLRLPIESFKYMPHKTKVPQGDQKTFDIRQVDRIDFIIGRWLYRDTLDRSHGFEVEFVGVAD